MLLSTGSITSPITSPIASVISRGVRRIDQIARNTSAVYVMQDECVAWNIRDQIMTKSIPKSLILRELVDCINAQVTEATYT